MQQVSYFLQDLKKQMAVCSKQTAVKVSSIQENKFHILQDLKKQMAVSSRQTVVDSKMSFTLIARFKKRVCFLNWACVFEKGIISLSHCL